MTVSYPYALADFSDELLITSCEWDIQRNDELSGTGNGRVFQAELAPPLWTVTVKLAPMRIDVANRIAAKIRKLNGSQEAFHFNDPTAKYPAADPTGSIIGVSTVLVNSVSSDRTSIRLKQLPVGYKLSPGDKMQIDYGSPTRLGFLEVSEETTADGSGISGLFGVFPNVPTGVVADQLVRLKRPALSMMIVPGSHRPGEARGPLVYDAGFKAIQKR